MIKCNAISSENMERSGGRSETEFCTVQTKYPSLGKEEIIDLLKRARKEYISCKIENKQETGLWAWQCIALRKLLDRENGLKVDLKKMSANAFLAE